MNELIEKTEKPEKKRKKRSTYTMDEDVKKLADRVIIVRSLLSDNSRESYSKLFSNLIKEEWLRQKQKLKETDILGSD